MKKISFLFLASCFLGLLLSSLSLHASEAVFKISIYSFPRSLDPQLQSSSTSYIFQNVFRNLYIYKGNGNLETDLAEKCQRNKKKKTLTCKLRKNLKWNTGEKLTANDFIKTYEKILNPGSQAQRPDFLFSIKNAKLIFEGKKAVTELGVKALNDETIEYSFEAEDGEFEYNLATFYLSPTKGNYQLSQSGPFYSTGPYQITKWETGKSISTSNNPHYHKQNNRPLVDYLVIEEDAVTLRLYDEGQISWVRRIPTLLTSKYKSRKDFHSVSALRFDYIGFGPELKDQLEVRKALSHSLNFPEWQGLLFSRGLPGCPGFPESWVEPKKPCYDFKKIDLKEKPSLKFVYSTQGGDDHRRTAEWLQNQWKKNLNLSIPVRGLENKTFVAELKKSAPPLFRKGLAPDRPTCSAIMENFTSDHPENYLAIKDPSFDIKVKLLRETQDTKAKKKLCRELLDFIMDSYRLIPTGGYDFAFLVSPQFQDWHLNELNQLDLTSLKAVKK